MEREILKRTAERIDHLITSDLPDKRRVPLLYRAAHELYGGSPTLLAAEKLAHAFGEPGRAALVCSGWPNRPMVDPSIAETDGPPGASVIARVLHQGFRAVPLLFFEEPLLPAMSAVVESAGLRALGGPAALRGIKSLGSVHVAGVLGFPAEIEAAKVRAAELLDEYRPAAVIVIEKGGMNAKGVIHSLRGEDITAPMAKVDFLIEEARARGILTVAIGDAGNEAGLGALAGVIRENLPFGKQCRCPCGAGTAPRSAAEVAIIADVSNWGAAALAGCLAMVKGEGSLLHTPGRERRLLEAAAAAGLVDGIEGW
ncbi:MAG: glutamate cyclase domain-containing protein, partial [Nitrospinota bacterium]